MILEDTLLQVTSEHYCRTDYRHTADGYRADMLLADRDKISITAIAAGDLELWEMRAFVSSDTTIKFRRNRPYTALLYTPNMAMFEEDPGGDVFYEYSFNLIHERSLCRDLTFNSHVPYIGFVIYMHDHYLAEQMDAFDWIHRFKPDVPAITPVIASTLAIPASWEIADLLADFSEVNGRKRQSPFLKLDVDYLASQTLYELDTLFRWQYVMRKYDAPLPF